MCQSECVRRSVAVDPEPLLDPDTQLVEFLGEQHGESSLRPTGPVLRRPEDELTAHEPIMPVRGIALANIEHARRAKRSSGRRPYRSGAGAQRVPGRLGYGTVIPHAADRVTILLLRR
jgi:hypothetical protein